MAQTKQPNLPKVSIPKTKTTKKATKKTEDKLKVSIPKTKATKKTGNKLKETTSKTKTTKKAKALDTVVSEQSKPSSSSYMVIGCLSNKTYTKIQKAFSHYQIDVHNIEPVEKTLEDLKALVGNKNYIIIDNTLNNEKYEITDKSFSKVFKNRSCGTWEQIVSNENAFVFTF